MIELILYYGAMSFLTWIAVTGWFFAYGKATELHDKGVSFPWHIKAAIYISLAGGVGGASDHRHHLHTDRSAHRF